MWYTWERKEKYKVLVGMPKVKRPLRRLRHRWKVEIRMYLRESG
jgi:hypothetical protein